MRILIINTDYPSFLATHYGSGQNRPEASYRDQMQARNDSLFGGFDAYSEGFRAAGHDAWEVHVNNGYLQTRWMIEHGHHPSPGRTTPTPSLPTRVMRRLRSVLRSRRADSTVTLRSPFPHDGWSLGEMLSAQVAHYDPDVILNQSMSEVGSDLLSPLRRKSRLIVGQIASPLPDIEDYRAYDLIVSSLPNFVAHFRRQGIPAELSRLGFDARVLAKVVPGERSIPVSFVGSLFPAHAGRLRLIEHLVRHSDLEIWGNGVSSLPPESPIRARHHGEAWGAEMFSLLGRSQITVNHHIDIAEGHANNMRLYEATGMGALLITDRKSDLGEIFEPGREVVCYDSHAECVELIAHYQNNPAEARAIAEAGQKRTLEQHSYRHRAVELVQLFERARS